MRINVPKSLNNMRKKSQAIMMGDQELISKATNPTTEFIGRKNL